MSDCAQLPASGTAELPLSQAPSVRGYPNGIDSYHSNAPDTHILPAPAAPTYTENNLSFRVKLCLNCIYPPQNLRTLPTHFHSSSAQLAQQPFQGSLRHLEI